MYSEIAAVLLLMYCFMGHLISMPYQAVDFLQTNTGYVVVLMVCLALFVSTNVWVGCLSLVAAYILLIHNVRNNNLYKYASASGQYVYPSTVSDDGRAPSSGGASFIGLETEMVQKMTNDVFNGNFVRPTWHAQYDGAHNAANA